MTKPLCALPRQMSTIEGYRRICDDLEAENESLKRQLIALRAEMAWRIDGSSPARRSFAAPFGGASTAAAIYV